MITSDKWATAHAIALGTNLPRFWVSLFGGVKPQTPEALSGAWNAPGPLLVYKNIVATNLNDYAILWATPVPLSRLLLRDQTIVAMGDGTAQAGANGTIATWVMIHAADDNLSADTSKYRAAMSVGTVGTEVMMSDPMCKQGVSKVLDFNFDIEYADPS